MEKIKIRRPRQEEKEQIYRVFEYVIIDTFERNGVGDLKEMIQEEIEDKKQFLMEDFQTDGFKHYFLVAEDEGQVIGTIECGKAGKLINDCTNNEICDLYEIGTVFLMPEYQGKGIGPELLKHMIIYLQSRGEKMFCLDSGYKTAQKIWSKKFGEPKYYLKNYWGEGIDHMVWVVDI